MDSEPNTSTSLPSVKNATEAVSPNARFESVYNQIEGHMKKSTNSDDHIGFSDVLREFERKGLFDGDSAFLRGAAALRNALVHNRIYPHLDMAIPTPEVIQRLESIRDKMLNPPKVFPLHKKIVATVSMEDTLAAVMGIVSSSDFSQFPVMDGKEVIGLLTENGITRWLARKIAGDISLVEFSDAQVRDLVGNEERRKNFIFVPRNTAIAEVREKFRRNGLLEAALITESGKSGEKLLGMINRWDLIEE
jgi:CBS domain-containing protein